MIDETRAQEIAHMFDDEPAVTDGEVAIRQLLADRAERVALLRRLEWSSGERTHYSCCPVCKADEDDKEHVPNCALAEALK